MTSWRVKQLCKKPSLKNGIFIEGLPGIGNVGKVAIDFIIDELGAKKIYEVTSPTFPNSVFVNENNLVELPKIEIFYKKFNNGNNDLLLLSGDVQPIDEVSSYEFSENILDIIESFHIKEIITLGGIGLSIVPKKPKIYCTGNSGKIIRKYKGENVNEKIYGVVGPIVGISGLLLGLSSRRKMDAIALLAETYGHPMYLGVKGSKETLKVLNDKLRLGINVDKLEKEIENIERQVLKRTEELGNISSKKGALKRFKGGEANYIG